MKPTQSGSSFSSVSEDESFFYYINEEKEDEINRFLSDNSKTLKIWTYVNSENQNSTVLHLSVYKKNLTIIDQIINYCKKKLNDEKEKLEDFINKKNEQGVTALHYASFRGNIQIIKLLVENGAKIDITTNRGLNVIHYAAQGNRSSSLMYFFNNHKNKLDFKVADNGGSTSLHWASYSSSVEVLLYILNLKIFDDEKDKENFINTRDKQGFTALHLAVLSKSMKVILKLLQNGADPKIKDNKNQTAYELAKSKNANDIAQKLLDSEGCQLCAFKAPVKKIKKNSCNIYLVSISQIFSLGILIFSVFPRFNNDLIFYLFFGFYFAFLIIFFILYIILINKNPGEIQGISMKELEKINDEGGNLNNYCPKCLVKKTENSEHCIICNKCYEDFDHHCYWINNCVAKRNYPIFIAFLFIAWFMLIIILASGIFGLIYGFKYKFGIKEKNFLNFIFYEQYMTHLVLNICLIVLNLFFLIPESMLVVLHMYVICYNKRHSKQRSSRGKSSAGDRLLSTDSSED